ncbi:5502_t:CDS:1, partial [Funneliformis caledonium]
TVIESCTPTETLKRRHYRDNDRYNCKNCKATKTVTIIPTVTVCATCCSTPGGPGFQNKIHDITGGGVIVIRDDLLTDTDCCKACLADPECIQWSFPGSCGLQFNTPNFDLCTRPVNETPFSAGIIHCSGDSGNCLA